MTDLIKIIIFFNINSQFDTKCVIVLHTQMLHCWDELDKKFSMLFNENFRRKFKFSKRMKRFNLTFEMNIKVILKTFEQEISFSFSFVK